MWCHFIVSLPFDFARISWHFLLSCFFSTSFSVSSLSLDYDIWLFSSLFAGDSCTDHSIKWLDWQSNYFALVARLSWGCCSFSPEYLSWGCFTCFLLLFRYFLDYCLSIPTIFSGFFFNLLDFINFCSTLNLILMFFSQDVTFDSSLVWCTNVHCC